jgi:hypothetical protein
MPEGWSRRSTRPIPTALLVLGAPVLGLLFVVTLPILGLAALGWGLARPHPGTPARPADGPEAGHPEPRHTTPG